MQMLTVIIANNLLCKDIIIIIFPVAFGHMISLLREAFSSLVTVGMKSKEAIILWGHQPVYAVLI